LKSSHEPSPTIVSQPICLTFTENLHHIQVHDVEDARTWDENMQNFKLCQHQSA